jgi:TonB family protein
MIKKNSTMYSVVGSLGVHMLFTLGAGSFLLNINNNVQEQKTYKLEFVKRKAPPPVKKEKIRKEPIRREIKVASLTPKAMPVLQPRTAVQPTRKAQTVPIPNSMPRQVQRTVMRSAISKTTVIHSSRSTRSQRVTTPVARSYASTNKRSSSKGRARIAMVQGASHYNLRKLPKRVISSSSTSSSKTTSSRATPLQSGLQLASLSSFPSPRGVPNINDRGALKSYIGQVQRSVEGSKRYPEASRRAGREGKLKIQFTILKNGEVDNVKLLTETPYPNLNREAMAAVKRAAPFNGFPNSIMEQSLKVILPFRFELN